MSPDGSPPLAATAVPREDRRLKLIGLVLVGLSMPGFYWISEHPFPAWPPGGDTLWRYGLIVAFGANLVVIGLLVLSAGFGKSRSLHDARARGATGLKLLAANIALPVAAYALVADDKTVDERLSQSAWGIPFLLLLFVLMFFALALLRRGRRTEALTAAEAMARDPRPPVLYLRSFQDDAAVALAGGGWRLPRRIGRLMVWATPEQELSRILNRIGPVVAIGKPGEPLPELGAARVYVAHADWQAVVGDLMRKAALVVVRVGESPGVLWEIEQALQHLPRERLLLVVLGAGPMAGPIAQRLAPVLGDVMAAAQPAPSGNRFTALFWTDPRRRLGAVVCFAADGTARAESVRSWPMAWQDIPVMMMARPSAGPLRQTFRRVFEHLKLGRNERAHGRSRALAIALAFFAGGVGSHWFYLGRRRRGLAYLVFFVLAVPIFLAWVDALRMILMDRAAFDERFA